MKKLIPLVVAIFMMNNLFAQKIDEKSVPSEAVKTFQSKFTQATDVKWEKSDALYKAVFIQNDLKTKVCYTATGQWIKTEWEIPQVYAPKTISDYISANFPKFKIMGLSIVEEDKSTLPGKYYIAEISNKKEVKSLKFNMKGEVMQDTMEKK